MNKRTETILEITEISGAKGSEMDTNPPRSIYIISDDFDVCEEKREQFRVQNISELNVVTVTGDSEAHLKDFSDLTVKVFTVLIKYLV